MMLGAADPAQLPWVYDCAWWGGTVGCGTLNYKGAGPGVKDCISETQSQQRATRR